MPESLRDKLLLRRVAALEERVTELEAALALRTPAAPAEEIEEPTVPGVEEVPDAEAVAPTVVEEQAPFDLMSDEDVEETLEAEAVEPTTVQYAPVPPPPAAPVREGDLEQTIGLKLAGWIGALVVIFGAALGVKHAYDAGWFGLAPPELRLTLMALCGFGLIGAGEWVYRRVNVVSAVGLFATGVATLFLVSYAGYGFLDVYSRTVAFVLMAVAALIGAGVAVRGRLVSIAIVAQLGGHLTPLVLGGDAENLVPLLSYLLMLQVVALVLAWWGGSMRWWVLRWLALAATSFWMMLVLVDDRGALPFTFSLIYAGLFMVEVVISAVRPPPGSATGDADQGHGVVFSLAVTTGLVLATMVTHAEAGRLVRAAWIVGYAVAYAVAGFAVSRVATGRVLGIGLRTQAAALAVLAVPIAFSGSVVVLVWAGMAITFGIVGARLNLAISRAASAATWMASGVYLVTALATDWMPPRPEDVAFIAFEVEVPVYALLAWTLALAGVVVAWLLSVNAPPISPEEAEEQAMYESDPQWPGIPPVAVRDDLKQAAHVLVALASGVWVVASLSALPPEPATLSLLVYAWLLAAGDLLLPRLWLIVHALAVLVLAAAKWALVDSLAQRLGEGWSPAQLQYTPILNPLTLLGSLVMASLVAMYLLRRRRIEALIDRTGAHANSVTAALTLAGAFLAFVAFGLALEIDRVIEAARFTWRLSLPPGQVRQLAFTALGSLALSAFAGLALRLERDPLAQRSRLAPLAVIPILIAAKYLLIDTLAPRLLGTGGGGLVLLNLETTVALVVLGTLALYAWPLRARPAINLPRSRIANALALAGLILLLFVGGYELWRAMSVVNVSPLARQVALSVWWALFAVGMVVLGFTVRIAGLRYFGLALLAITLVKVFLIDLQTLSRGWRTLSFIAVGLLLLATSVLYGKYSPKLLERVRD